MKIGMKEYCEAIEHWTEMYRAFLECDDWKDTGNGILFYEEGSAKKMIGYKSRDCSYCDFLWVIYGMLLCYLCPLADIECGRRPSPWYSFIENPSSNTALDMLVAIVEHPPEGAYAKNN